jgi:hypothetical protein
MIEKYNLSRTTWECLIDDWVFNERDRKILKRRLLDGICFEPLAEEFDLSVRQVKAIVYKSQKRLFEIVDKSL